MEKPNNLEECDNFGQEKSENVTGDIDLTKSFGEINRPPLRYVDKYVRPRLFGLSARYTVAFMAMIAFIVKFGMRCNLGAAKLEKSCNFTGVENLPWNTAVESMAESNFFWSYIITQIPGGLLASVFPANRVFGIALLTSSVLHMFLPAATKLDTTLLIIRVLQGLVEIRAWIV
ncbi:Vesicular glutamate transporter 2 [Pseudolycoriella hygida]|uniref:Vesicular glutamate transporter 2 n=1 Tax=Pseudolycoriella hygida TaxID=35572 RepID=A0A9Q0MYM9_9DIPT|nr:Vesicular glutamate transporter 2 [Pseudolycoriella hygida]